MAENKEKSVIANVTNEADKPKKNILLLSMSTLSNYVAEWECRCADKEDDKYKEKYYFGQLEPVTFMLINKFYACGEHLDKIFIMATEEAGATKEMVEKDKEKYGKYRRHLKLKATGENGGKKDIEYEGEVNAVEFFEKRVLDYEREKHNRDKDKLVEFVEIQLDIENPSAGIKAVVSGLREEFKNYNVSLYLDIHGGFREQQLDLEAVLSLLRGEKIIPVKMYTVTTSSYSIDEKKTQSVGTIKTVPPSEDMFRFVTGMNEFFSYGRADGIIEYLNSVNGSSDLIDIVKSIADAIQMCDIDTFEKNLDELNGTIPKNNDDKTAAPEQVSYLDIFVDTIKKDYGDNLLESKSRTDFELLKWCAKKGLYQQALTIIESKMPEYICRNFLMFQINNQGKISTFGDKEFEAAINGIKCEEKVKKLDWKNPINYAFEKCVTRTVGYNWYISLLEGGTPEEYYRKYAPKWEKSYNYSYSAWINWEDSVGRKCSEKVIMKKKLYSDSENHKLNILFQLHMALKNQRNLVNHAAPLGEREPSQNIFNAIHAYIKMVDYFNKLLGINTEKAKM